MNKDIFKTRADAIKQIEDRGKEFIYLAAEAINSLSIYDSAEDAPGFLNSYHGFDVTVQDYDHVEWVNNPNYDKSLSADQHRENHSNGINTGFAQIDIHHPRVCISAHEVQDTWDDCAGDPEEWVLQDIPQDLFFDGDKEQIQEYFKEKYRERVERENENHIRCKWTTLAQYSLDDIKNFYEIASDPRFYDAEGYFVWKEIDRAVNILEGRNDAIKEA